MRSTVQKIGVEVEIDDAIVLAVELRRNAFKNARLREGHSRKAEGEKNYDKSSTDREHEKVAP